jgi:hypothetical protein
MTRRRARLQSSGILYFDVQCDPALLGYHVQTMLWLTVTPTALDAIGYTLAAHPEIGFAAATTGPTNLIAFALARTTGDLYTIETALMLRSVKHLAAGVG